MKSNRRWLKSVINTAEKTETLLPWARGPQRQKLKNRVAARDVRKLAVRA